MKKIFIILSLLIILGCATVTADKDPKQEDKSPINYNEVIRALEKIPFPKF